MKCLILTSVICLAGTVAHAKVIKSYYSEVIADGVVRTQYTAVGVVDTAAKKMKLQIYSDPCGQQLPAINGEAKCEAASSLKTTIEVDLKQTGSSCGDIYVGEKGDNFADGYRTKMTITDNNQNMCEGTGLIPPQYIITVERTGGFAGTTNTISGKGEFRRGGVTPNPSTDVQDDQDIYNALKVKEVNMSEGMAGSLVMKKSVGDLTCYRSTVVSAKPVTTYSCSLDRK